MESVLWQGWVLWGPLVVFMWERGLYSYYSWPVPHTQAQAHTRTGHRTYTIQRKNVKLSLLSLWRDCHQILVSFPHSWPVEYYYPLSTPLSTDQLSITIHYPAHSSVLLSLSTPQSVLLSTIHPTVQYYYPLSSPQFSITIHYPAHSPVLLSTIHPTVTSSVLLSTIQPTVQMIFSLNAWRSHYSGLHTGGIGIMAGIGIGTWDPGLSTIYSTISKMLWHAMVFLCQSSRW